MYVPITCKRRNANSATWDCQDPTVQYKQKTKLHLHFCQHITNPTPPGGYFFSSSGPASGAVRPSPHNGATSFEALPWPTVRSSSMAQPLPSLLAPSRRNSLPRCRTAPSAPRQHGGATPAADTDLEPAHLCNAGRAAQAVFSAHAHRHLGSQGHVPRRRRTDQRVVT